MDQRTAKNVAETVNRTSLGETKVFSLNGQLIRSYPTALPRERSRPLNPGEIAFAGRNGRHPLTPRDVLTEAHNPRGFVAEASHAPSSHWGTTTLGAPSPSIPRTEPYLPVPAASRASLQPEGIGL
ncbi:MAG: hypothetical protein FWD59_05445 [Micrococcales bacterium]|nr:hypothetical protein [Micrococcales bacterium]